MVIAEKQNILADHRQQRMGRMNRILFGPRVPQLRPEWNSQILRSMDLSGIERGVASDPSMFPSLFHNGLLQSVFENISPRRSLREPEVDSEFDETLSPSTQHRMTSSAHDSYTPHQNSSESDIHIIPITFIRGTEKISVKSRSKDSPSKPSSTSLKDNEKSIPVIVIPNEASDDDISDDVVITSPLPQKVRKSDVRSNTKSDAAYPAFENVVIIDDTPDIKVKETENKSAKVLRSNKDTLVGGANKVHADMSPDVYIASDTMDIPAGAAYLHAKQDASGTRHDKHPNSDEEKPVNDVPDYPIYSFLKSKLKKECRQIDHIKGDGNCFFRALSKQLYGSERFHIVLRNLIVDLIATNKNKFAQFVDGGDVQDHVERMSQEQSWATTCEIYAAATLLQRDIFMLTPDHLNETYSWLLFKPVFKMDPQQCNIEIHPCYISLCNTNGNHYDRIVGEHGGCNCFLPHPELEGFSYSVDLTC